jgi:hypothetical protein
MHQGRLSLPHLLCQTGFQVCQLQREATAEFVQKCLSEAAEESLVLKRL